MVDDEMKGNKGEKYKNKDDEKESVKDMLINLIGQFE